MTINATKVSDLIDLLWKLDDAKKQGLIENPQSETMETELKAEIDTEIAS